MRNGWFTSGLVGSLALLTGLVSAFAGDSLYGKITAVRSADLVVLDYGTGHYDVRIVGVSVPAKGKIALEATKFVTSLALGRDAHMRLEGRNAAGEMVSRLFISDSTSGVKEVGVELLSAGLARRLPNYDYKYGELSKAESAAKKARRGLWALAPSSSRSTTKP